MLNSVAVSGDVRGGRRYRGGAGGGRGMDDGNGAADWAVGHAARQLRRARALNQQTWASIANKHTVLR